MESGITLFANYLTPMLYHGNIVSTLKQMLYFSLLLEVIPMNDTGIGKNKNR